MGIRGEEKVQKSYKKYVGVFSGNIVAINPTNIELGKLLGSNIEKDLEYTSFNDKTGAKRLALSFWIKPVQIEDTMFNVRLYLEDTMVESKEGKPQFINTIGNASYAVNEESLPSFITNNGRTVRRAMKGEENLYKFLQAWLSNLDYTNENTEVKLNFKNLISNKLDELKSAITEFSEQTVGCLATVRIENDGNEYQSVYPYEFLPAYAVNSFYAKTKSFKVVDRFIERVTDTEYGCNDYFILDPLQEYDSSKNVLNTTNVVIKEKAPAKSAVQEAADDKGDMEDDLPF